MSTSDTAPEEVGGWRPSEGESITGKVVDLDRGWSDWGQDFYPIVTLETEDGKRVNVHCFHAVLRNRLAAIAPKLGDPLTITYKGKKPSKDGRREVAIYSVEAPNRVMDAAAFWQGTGATHPDRSGTSTPESDIPADSAGLEDIPF